MAFLDVFGGQISPQIRGFSYTNSRPTSRFGGARQSRWGAWGDCYLASFGWAVRRFKWLCLKNATPRSVKSYMYIYIYVQILADYGLSSWGLWLDNNGSLLSGVPHLGTNQPVNFAMFVKVSSCLLSLKSFIIYALSSCTITVCSWPQY